MRPDEGRDGPERLFDRLARMICFGLPGRDDLPATGAWPHVPLKEDLLDELKDVGGCIRTCPAIPPLRRLWCDVGSVFGLIWMRLTNGAAATGTSLVGESIATASFATHSASSDAVGGPLVAWFFTVNTVVAALTLLRYPALQNRPAFARACTGLALACGVEGLFLDMPSAVTEWLRLGLGLLVVGLLLMAGWAWSGRPGDDLRFRVGTWIVVVGALIAGGAECQTARLLAPYDGLWALSAALSGLAAFWAALTAPRMIPLAASVYAKPGQPPGLT